MSCSSPTRRCRSTRCRRSQNDFNRAFTRRLPVACSTVRRMKRLVVVGSGMVGHRFVELMIEAGAGWHIDVFGEEPELAYDRVNLSSFFDGKSRADLSL